MDSRTASTLSIGVLGGVAVAVTATVLPVPIWVVFLAWACFFFVGGGVRGWVRSVTSKLIGVAIATASLYAADMLGGGVVMTSIAVGVGSAAMVQASWIPLLSTTPAVVVGFASTVSTVAGLGVEVTVASLSHPALVAAVACTLGASFGLLSELLASVLVKKTPAPEGSPTR